ncbi:MAG: hypothetical protein AAFY10_08020 [Pseudomonadota bacterium]
MWPFIPASEIDWSATIAGCSAIVAAGALTWNVYWSKHVAERGSALSIATKRIEWIQELRGAMSRFLATANALDNDLRQKDVSAVDRYLSDLVKDAQLVVLLLNEEEPKHKLLVAEINEIGRRAAEGSLSIDGGRPNFSGARGTCSDIIREEWVRAKHEIETGKVSK